METPRPNFQQQLASYTPRSGVVATREAMLRESGHRGDAWGAEVTFAEATVPRLTHGLDQKSESGHEAFPNGLAVELYPAIVCPTTDVLQ